MIMTTPQKAIDTTFGRFYVYPGSDLPVRRSKKAIRELLDANLLFPSTTTAIGALNGDLEGYALSMSRNAERNGVYDSKEADKEYIRYRDWAAERGNIFHSYADELLEAGYASSADKLKYVISTGLNKELPSYQAAISYEDNVFCEQWFYSGGPKEAKMLKLIDSLHKFILDFNPTFIASEVTVYGKTTDNLYYAGTLDFIAEINGVKYVGDWKTSSSLHASYALQVAAGYGSKKISYDNENVEDTPEFDAGLIVRFDGKGGYETMVTDLQEGWEHFKAARQLWETYAFGEEKLFKGELV